MVENRRGDYCRIKSVLNSKTSKRPPPFGYDEIEYLIATVPDPKDTRLDHKFDRTLDAIQRAVAAAGYTFDRYWLPWDRGKTNELTTSPADPRTAHLATRHLRDPGVILFRNSESKNLLLLFLVGETPTDGIHRVAFQTALRQVEELPSRVGLMTEEPEGEKRLRILGPYFPGSDDSLAILLKEWIYGLKRTPDVKIITGSVGSINKEDFLRKDSLSGVSLFGTQVNSSQANKVFFKDLMKRDSLLEPSDGGGPARAHIAFLSEGSTARGQIWRDYIELNRAAAGNPLDKQPKILSLTYPVHISQLRVEAAKSPLRDDVTTAPPAKDSNLPLPMREAGSPGSKDTAHLFSPLETVTMELALREMLTAIHRERIRYVSVSATDPQDRIFLVHELRKYCPNAMIVTLSADLLYLHSDYNHDFQGALVLSSYPLFGFNQLWTYPFEGDERRPQFPTPTEQGVFNATLALLDRPDRMLEYGVPLKNTTSAPSATRRCGWASSGATASGRSRPSISRPGKKPIL